MNNYEDILQARVCGNREALTSRCFRDPLGHWYSIHWIPLISVDMHDLSRFQPFVGVMSSTCIRPAGAAAGAAAAAGGAVGAVCRTGGGCSGAFTQPIVEVSNEHKCGDVMSVKCWAQRWQSAWASSHVYSYSLANMFCFLVFFEHRKAAPVMPTSSNLSHKPSWTAKYDSGVGHH